MLKFGNTYLNFGGTYFDGWTAVPNPNPLNLPQGTVRVRTSDGNAPTGTYVTYDSATLVPGTNDVYDVHNNLYDGVLSFRGMFNGCKNLVEVLGANASALTSTNQMFTWCGSLESVALFDTSKVTDMYKMFQGCSSLTSVPLFDTSKVKEMRDTFDRCIALSSVPLFNTSEVTSMINTFYSCSSLSSIPLFNTNKLREMGGTFQSCFNVESGALDLYNQVSTQPVVPNHDWHTFNKCGISSENGIAELAQIPSGWRGNI